MLINVQNVTVYVRKSTILGNLDNLGEIRRHPVFKDPLIQSMCSVHYDLRCQDLDARTEGCQHYENCTKRNGVNHAQTSSSKFLSRL